MVIGLDSLKGKQVVIIFILNYQKLNTQTGPKPRTHSDMLESYKSKIFIPNIKSRGKFHNKRWNKISWVWNKCSPWIDSETEDDR